MPKPFAWKPPELTESQADDPRYVSHYSDQHGMDHSQNVGISYIAGDNTSTNVDNDFNINDHITDMDSLLGRSPAMNVPNRYEEELMNQPQ